MSDTATLTYETACTRIEEVIRRLDSGEAGLRETLELCQEGRRLVEFCAGELDAVAHGLEELRLDELVARLEAGSRPGATAQAAGPSAAAPPRRAPCAPLCPRRSPAQLPPRGRPPRDRAGALPAGAEPGAAGSAGAARAQSRAAAADARADGRPAGAVRAVDVHRPVVAA